MREKRIHFWRVYFPAAFISLLDNYESDTGEPEIVTPEEVAENHKFLDSIIQTPTMKVTPSTLCLSFHSRAGRFIWRFVIDSGIL